ncbi:MAG: polyphosphate kinase 2 [Proteobacteria bacterium]|nr:polyphosphate kinase 2 [Pseudomonadota bacterium]
MAKSAKSKDREHAKVVIGNFDLDDPKLPEEIAEGALPSGGYPYDKKLKRDPFEEELHALQIELVKLQAHVAKSGERIVVVFEGRDAAGKGSCIDRFRAHLNPRRARVVALPKPTETERGQWYFQRYAAELPTAGEIVLFDRSWYNRAGVEQVMGFASADQVADFLREAPEFEGMLVRDGIHLFKIYLEIGRLMQLERFHERRHDPLKRWKISEMDLAAMHRYDDYTHAKEEMFRFTHTAVAPWRVVLANDQRRARLESIRVVLHALDYEGKDSKVVRAPDERIVGAGPDFFHRPA